MEALGELRAETALPLLEQAIRKERFPSVRRHIVKALVMFDSPSADEAIAQALLQEEHNEVRASLIKAFEERKLIQYTDILEQALLREDRPKLRRRIQKLLRLFQTSHVVF